MLTCSECGRRHTIGRNESSLMIKEWIFSFDVISPKAKRTNLSPLNIEVTLMETHKRKHVIIYSLSSLITYARPPA